MPIFLDTGNIKEVERFHRMGIIRGVTTNPTILLKDGVTGGMKGIEACSKEIAKMIAPLPLSVEVTTTERKKVIQQAQTFAGWADNIIVKVTIHGPEGELENLEIIKSDCKTGLPDESIDIVLLYDLFHNLSDPNGILGELHRVSKPKGILSFNDHQKRMKYCPE